jgi:adenosylmethionine-8-amino-7-oxononanoate aminotransferase
VGEFNYPSIGGTQDVFFDRRSSSLLPRIVAGQGTHLIDEYGRRLLDACSGPFLASLAGPGFERAHLTSGGSEAVEMALKFLRAHAVATGQSQRSHVISLVPGYHGATLQTIGLNGDVSAPFL